MRIELRHLRAFQAVADELHFRRAAERLSLAQPALSRTIQQLEEAVGEELLLRSNRRVELTAAGRAFLDGSVSVFERLDDAIEQAHKAGVGQLGQLRIGYTDFAVTGRLPVILEEFHRHFPEVRTELIYGPTQHQLELLKDGQIDFAFLTAPVSDPAIESLVIQRDRFVAAFAELHPLARTPEVRLQDLATEPFVVGDLHNWSHYRRQLDALCMEAGFLPRIVQEAYNSEGIFGFVAANIGITLHLECAGNFSRKGVVLRHLQGTDTRVATEAAWRKAPLTPVQRHFVEFLRQLDPPS